MVSDMIKKIRNGFKYSCNGLKATIQKDASFRLEVYGLPLVLIALAFFQVSPFRKMVMLAAYLLVLCLELLNSAIEKLADRITTEHDAAIGFVKDAASASVMLAFVVVVVIWIACLWF